MSITRNVWPLVSLLVWCVVCLQFTPTVFSYEWVAFLKSASSFDLEKWKKKKSENEEKSSSTVGLFVILDNISSSRSWWPENWRLVHNQSRSVQTYRSFNQLIESFKRFYTRWYSNNQFLTVLSLLYGSIQIEITEKASLRFWLRVQSLIFLLDTVGCEHARTTSGEAARNEGWLIYFSPCIGVLVLVFLLSSVLFHNHQILMASLAFFP